MTPIQELIALLGKNADLYEQMALSLQEESIAIQQNDLARMNEAVKEKENISLKLKLVEEGRKSLVRTLSRTTGIPEPDISIRQLAELPENRDCREEFLAAGDRLRKAILKVTEGNEFNRRLLTRAMGIVKDSMRFLNNILGGPGQTYTNGKTVTDKYPSGMVVTRSY